MFFGIELAEIGMALFAIWVITLILRAVKGALNFIADLFPYLLALSPAAICVVCWLTGILWFGILSTIVCAFFYFFYIKHKWF